MSSLSGGFRPEGPSGHNSSAEEAHESGDDDDPVANHARQSDMLDADPQEDLENSLDTPCVIEPIQFMCHQAHHSRIAFPSSASRNIKLDSVFQTYFLPPRRILAIDFLLLHNICMAEPGSCGNRAPGMDPALALVTSGRPRIALGMKQRTEPLWIGMWRDQGNGLDTKT